MTFAENTSFALCLDQHRVWYAIEGMRGYFISTCPSRPELGFAAWVRLMGDGSEAEYVARSLPTRCLAEAVLRGVRDGLQAQRARK